MHHSNLKSDIRSEMHRLTKFLDIRPDIGKFRCVTYNSKSLTYKYTPGKMYFDPYKLLKPTVHQMMNVSKTTIMKLINQRMRGRK